MRPEIENSTNAIIFNVIYMKQKESLNSEVDSAFSLGKIKKKVLFEIRESLFKSIFSLSKLVHFKKEDNFVYIRITRQFIRNFCTFITK